MATCPQRRTTTGSVPAASRRVLPLEEVIEDKGAALLRDFLSRRLVPLGAVQLGLDEKRRYVAARLPRLDLYFGAEVEEAPAAAEQSRVVVQPDFSVVIIGLNPAPGADLAPFCERLPGRASPGTLQLKITREAVVRAVAQGLKPAELAARLRKHATTPVPANVLHEVQEWAGWVREVQYATWTVFRCPDRARGR